MPRLTARGDTPVSHPNGDLPSDPIYRLSVEQYHAMAKAGILDEDAPVELLDGWLVEKMTKNPPHSIATRRVRDALNRLIPDTWYADSQEPITTDDSEPEPDVRVARAEVRENRERHPTPEEVPLVVEVAESSLRRDRTTKLAIYARARIAVYWIVNLVDGRIEVYSEPSGPRNKPFYRSCREYGPSDEIPVVLDGALVGSLAVRDLLP